MAIRFQVAEVTSNPLYEIEHAPIAGANIAKALPDIGKRLWS